VPAPKVSEEEFIKLFNDYASPARVAEVLGTDVRAVHYRRRSIEKRRGIDLLALSPPQKTLQDELNKKLGVKIPRSLFLEVENGTVIVASDCHYWPGEPTLAHKALVKLTKELKPKAVILNGDVLDGARISRHDPLYGTNPPTVKQEIDVCVERLGEIEKAYNNAALIWLYGNHDTRLWRYIHMNAPEVSGMPGTDIFDYFPGWRHSYILDINNNTIVKHRWHNGVHATYNNVLKGFGHNIVTGHLHRLCVTPWNGYNNSGRRYGVDTGTLAEPSDECFAYLEGNPTPWGSGFVVLTFRDHQLVHPEICEVANGAAWFRGEKVL
jgi:predicted phosphodiesterase